MHARPSAGLARQKRLQSSRYASMKDRSNRSFVCCREFRVIGQKVLMKTAVVVEKSMVTAVISFLKQDTGWTKSVDENASAH